MALEIIGQSAVELVRRIQQKELSCREVMQAFLQRIERVNPKINAIHQVAPERLLQQAEEKDRQIAKGERLGRLHGLPISMKNHCDVAGFVCNKGSYLLPQTACTTNATMVQRLLDEGAIIVGLTNVPELLVAFESENLIYGRTNNPYNLERIAGGSSGGEAALIAAGGSPLGIGSDAGGSIRQPAHVCGIVGHKPTHQTIPVLGKMPAEELGLIYQVLTYGPMARYVDDLSLSLSILQGPDHQDPYCVPVPALQPFTPNLKKLRVGYFLDNEVVRCCPVIQAAVLNVVNHLGAEGAQVEAVRIPQLPDLYTLLWETLICNGAGTLPLRQWVEAARQTYSPVLQRFLDMPARVFDTATHKQYWIQINRFRMAMWQLMQSFDVLISPVTHDVAWPHTEAGQHFQTQTFCSIYNLTGAPVTVVPCALSSSGLPIGVQIAAKPFSDSISLGVAKYLQQWLGVFTVVDP